MGVQVLPPLKCGHPPCRDASDDDLAPIIKIVVFVQVVELFKGVVGSSEVEVSIFVGDGIISVPEVLGAITVDGEDLCPIMENLVCFRDC